MNYIGGFKPSYNKTTEKVAKVFFWCLILIIFAIIIFRIVILIADNIRNDQITKEELIIQEYVLDYIHNSIDDYEICINEIDVHIQPDKFFAPITERIPLSSAKILIRIQCTDLPDHENRVRYISLSKDCVENYLLKDSSLFKINDIYKIEMYCGTLEQFHQNECLCISFFNHTFDLLKNQIPNIDYEDHCVMYTLNDLSMSELENFSYCRQIEINNITDINEDISFVKFGNLNYLHIYELSGFDKNWALKVKERLPGNCMLIYP